MMEAPEKDSGSSLKRKFNVDDNSKKESARNESAAGSDHPNPIGMQAAGNISQAATAIAEPKSETEAPTKTLGTPFQDFEQRYGSIPRRAVRSRVVVLRKTRELKVIWKENKEELEKLEALKSSIEQVQDELQHASKKVLDLSDNLMHLRRDASIAKTSIGQRTILMKQSMDGFREDLAIDIQVAQESKQCLDAIDLSEFNIDI